MQTVVTINKYRKYKCKIYQIEIIQNTENRKYPIHQILTTKYRKYKIRKTQSTKKYIYYKAKKFYKIEKYTSFPPDRDKRRAGEGVTWLADMAGMFTNCDKEDTTGDMSRPAGQLSGEFTTKSPLENAIIPK